jgi:hypothetical protein
MQNWREYPLVYMHSHLGKKFNKVDPTHPQSDPRERKQQSSLHSSLSLSLSLCMCTYELYALA